MGRSSDADASASLLRAWSTALQEGQTRQRLGEQAIAACCTRRSAAQVLVFACLTVCCSVWGVLASGARLSPMSWTPPAAESLRADGLLASRFAGGEPHLVLLATASGSVDDARSARAGRVLVESLAADPRTACVRAGILADEASRLPYA